MNFCLGQSFRRLGLLFALAAAARAQTPPPPAEGPAGAAADFGAGDWSGARGRKNDRVQIFGSNQIAADEKINGDAVAVVGGNTVEGAVSHDVVAVMGSNLIDGSVGHDAVSVMGQTIINGTVGHNVVSVMGGITLGPNAVVQGDVVSVGGSIQRAPGAVVRGRIVSRSYNPAPRGWDPRPDFRPGRPDDLWRTARPKSDWANFLAAYHRWWWAIGCVALACYALLALAFPHAVRECGDALAHRPGVVILTTLLALLALPLLFVLLCITVIGIPLAIVFLPLAVLAAMLFGKAALFALIGRNLSRDRLPLALAVLLGGLLCAVLYLVPVLGWLVSFILATLGFGCVVTALLAAARPAVSRAVAPPPPPPVPPPGVPPPPAPAAPAAAPFATIFGPATGAAPSAPPPLAATAGAAAAPCAPAPSATALLPRAGFWIRMAALFIDALIVGFGLHLLLLPAFLLFPFFVFLSPRFLVLALYGALMWKYKGTTIGGMIFGLHVVRLDHRPIEWDTAIVRALGCFLSAAALFLGFIWIAFDEDKQAWHDKIAGTVVVRARGVPLV